MTGKVIVITGASDGIGEAGARELTARGHEVVIVGRSPEKTRRVARELGADYFVADFAELDQVRALATELERTYSRIDVLANNAGGLFGNQRLTVDGFETILQVNHLAPFLLTTLLMPTLLSSGASVIATSSIANRVGRIDLDDLNNERRYSPNKAYGDSKLENILFTRALHNRFQDRGLSAAAFHPGGVATNFAHDTPSFMKVLYRTPLRSLVFTSPEKGADQLVWLSDSEPGAEWQSGEYYVKRSPGSRAAQAKDDEFADALWERTASMVGAPILP
jgi:NAD(P)-dependent dehydrogenase (short-subunit alcohol dehydrogenase family)